MFGRSSTLLAPPTNIHHDNMKTENNGFDLIKLMQEKGKRERGDANRKGFTVEDGGNELKPPLHYTLVAIINGMFT